MFKIAACSLFLVLATGCGTAAALLDTPPAPRYGAVRVVNDSELWIALWRVRLFDARTQTWTGWREEVHPAYGFQPGEFVEVYNADVRKAFLETPDADPAYARMDLVLVGYDPHGNFAYHYRCARDGIELGEGTTVLTVRSDDFVLEG